VHPFEYARPETLNEALALLGAHGARAKLLAGGTDLLVRLRRRHVHPKIVIDLKRIERLQPEVVEVDGCLRVGARTVMTDLIEDHRIRRHFPALIEAAAVVGSIQIRNRATLAGNICNASPAADTAPALLAYGALVNLVAASGPRRIALADFFIAPGRTVLKPDELVESIDLPLPSEPTGAAFGRLTRRFGVDLAIVNMCCAVARNGQTRAAFGAVGPRPFVVEDTIDVAEAGDSTRSSQEATLERLISRATPVSDVRGSRDYRVAMLTVMGRRTLQAAVDRLRSRNAHT
jgi:CO/xanthine dehydrogenase FAD-binding subunit